MRVLCGFLLIAASAIALLALVFPAFVAIREALGVGDWSSAALTGARLVLIARALEIAAESATLACVLGGALAFGIVCSRGALRVGLIWSGATTLLAPPYIYAYALSLLLLRNGVTTGQEFAGGWHQWIALHGRTIWCLGAWVSPLAAAAIITGWRTAGQAAFALAVQDAPPMHALLSVLRQALAPWFALAFLGAFLLAFTEYSVPSLCLIITWNTQILADVQALNQPGQALLLGWPLVLLVLTVLVLLWALRHVLREFLVDVASFDARDLGTQAASPRTRAGGALLGVVTALLLLAPWGVLMATAAGIQPFIATWSRYADQWPGSMYCAGGAAILAGVVALGADFALFTARRGANREGDEADREAGLAGRIRRRTSAGRRFARLVVGPAAIVIVVLLFLGALLPPALVGDAFAAAYADIRVVRDQPLIVSLLGVARYGALAAIAMLLAGQTSARDAAELATVDGADVASAFWRVRVRAALRPLAAAMIFVGLLTFSEAAASTLIRPPNVGSVAQTMLAAIHNGRDEQVAAMCLYMWLTVGGGVAVVGMSLRQARGARQQ